MKERDDNNPFADYNINFNDSYEGTTDSIQSDLFKIHALGLTNLYGRKTKTTIKD